MKKLNDLRDELATELGNKFDRPLTAAAIRTNVKIGFDAGVAAHEQLVQGLVDALEFYANKDNWEYTDSGCQFSWHTTIKNSDCPADLSMDEGGGVDYAGHTAREALTTYRKARSEK